MRASFATGARAAVLAAAGFLVVAAWAARAAASPPAPSSGGVCIDQAVIDKVTECPSGAKGMTGSKKTGTPTSAFSASKHEVSKIDTSKFKKGQTGPGVTDIQSKTLAQMRKEKQKIADKLLVKELELTKKLIKNMSDTDPKKPDAFFRIAELNFELQQNFGFKAMDLEEPLFNAKEANDKEKFVELKKKQKAYLEKSEQYRMDAITAYAQLVKNFPDYDKMDEALFYLGFALDEIARTFPDKKVEYADKARDIYKRLIKEFPDSKYIPNAYLSFAEFWFNEGDMGNALKFYKEVAKYQDANVYSFALYKQAWCLFNMQDYKATIEQFVEVIDYAQQHPEDPNSGSLLKQSRMEIVMPYAQIGTPDHAWEFFSKYGGDLAEEEMQLLAENYFGQGMWKEAISTYHKLMEISPDSESICDWQYWITFATNSLKNKEDQLAELKNLTKMVKHYRDGGHPEELRNDCVKKGVGMILDQGIFWHREAVGTDTQPGTNDPKTMRLAADVYNLVVTEFPELDTIPQEGEKGQWITLYKIAYYKAELLWKMEDWVKCGPAFDAVVELEPEGEYVQDAAYASVLCYNNLYHMYHKEDKGQKHNVKAAYEEAGTGGKASAPEKGEPKKKGKKGKEKKDDLEEKIAEFEAKPIASTEQKMLDAFNRYTCYVKQSEDLSNIKYRKARIYYETNNFAEAAHLFKDVAVSHVKDEVGVYAANLYIDSLYSVWKWNDLMVEKEKRKPEAEQGDAYIQQLTDRKLACNDDISAAVDMFLTDPKFKPYLDDPQFADNTYTVKCNIERLKAEDYHKNKQFKEAALSYYSLYKKWGKQCTGAKLDEVLFNMAIEFEAARLIGAAIKARQGLIDAYPDSEWAKRAAFFIGQNYHAIALYDKAAEYYEKYAQKFPGEKEAPEALQNATFFRLGLGQDEKAVQNAMLFQKNYSTGKMKRPAEVAMVFFGIGTIYKKKEQWSKVAEHYNTYVKKYNSPSTIDFTIRANVETANAYWRIGKTGEAEKYYKVANDQYGLDPMKKMVFSGETPAEQETDKAVRGKSMFDAVAQARFYLGEISYKKFKEIKFPLFDPEKIKTTDLVYSDDPAMAEKEKSGLKNKFQFESKEAFLKFVNYMKFNTWTKKYLKDWQTKKADAMKKADAFFGDTIKIGIEQWEIAAAARHGDMYREFFQALYDAPVPDIIKEDPDMLDTYNDTRDKMALEYKNEAVVGFEHCIEKSKEKRWFNEWSSLCEKELNKLDAKKYPISFEIRTKATLAFSKPADPKLVDKILTAAEIKEKKIEVGAGLEEGPKEGEEDGGQAGEKKDEGGAAKKKGKGK